MSFTKNENGMERYSRQSVFSFIGEEGQKKLLKSKVAIIGMGALGTVAANNLCRAGVGFIRMADRDYVEITNLQRQILYDESDAKQSLPKVIAAYNHLTKINSEISLEPVITDVNSSNIEQLIRDVDLVLDATDNWEIRLLINEACIEFEIPWIYCGALGGEGMTMNILQGKDTPCLKCFVPEAMSTPNQTCSSYGVLNMVTNAIASVQTAEAIKILINSEDIRDELLIMNLWKNHMDSVKIEKNSDCPACVHKQYEYFGKMRGSYTTNLCGTNSIQIVPSVPAQVDFQTMAARLKKIGKVEYNRFTLTFSDNKYEIMLFQDGRAIIKNTIDENNARSVYTEYIGL